MTAMRRARITDADSRLLLKNFHLLAIFHCGSYQWFIESLRDFAKKGGMGRAYFTNSARETTIPGELGVALAD
jgi:hypothetical protein